jgi:hypothetical protein
VAATLAALITVSTTHADIVASGSQPFAEAKGSYSGVLAMTVYTHDDPSNPSPGIAGQLTYVYSISNDAESQLGIIGFNLSAPICTVASAGWIPDADPLTAPPSNVIDLNNGVVRWDWALATGVIEPGTASEALYVVSTYEPGTIDDSACSIEGDFGFDLNTTGIAPLNPPAVGVEVFTAVLDNTLFNNLTNSGGAGPAIFSGRTGSLAQPGGIIQRALLKFDTCCIPRGSTVHSAELTVYLEKSISGDQTHTLHKVLQSWGEGTSTATGGAGSAATAGDATWELRYFPGSPWTNPGGDYEPTVSGSATVGLSFSAIPIVWNSTAVMAGDVQAWVENASSNFGWMMKGNEAELTTAKKFVSRESLDTASHPVLTVTYSPPEVICRADCGGSAPDGQVDVSDLLALLAGWGNACQNCDINCDGTIDTGDLLAMLADWGRCQPGG